MPLLLKRAGYLQHTLPGAAWSALAPRTGPLPPAEAPVQRGCLARRHCTGSGTSSPRCAASERACFPSEPDEARAPGQPVPAGKRAISLVRIASG